MSNEIPPDYSDGKPSGLPEHQCSQVVVTTPAAHKAKDFFQKWLQAVGAGLERAEKCVVENFKVPPNGG